MELGPQQRLYQCAYPVSSRCSLTLKFYAPDLALDSYCVAGSPKSCSKIYTVASGDYCSLVESKNSITDASLRALNPWLDANCDMQIGQNLCVAAASTAPSLPTDIAPGTWTK